MKLTGALSQLVSNRIPLPSLMYLTGVCRILPPEVESMRFSFLHFLNKPHFRDITDEKGQPGHTVQVIVRTGFLFRDYFIGALTKQPLKKQSLLLFLSGVMHCWANTISRKVVHNSYDAHPHP